MSGYDLTIEDVYVFQQLCAYEVGGLFGLMFSRRSSLTSQTVALGYSKFCELFTEEEWKGFNYA